MSDDPKPPSGGKPSRRRRRRRRPAGKPGEPRPGGGQAGQEATQGTASGGQPDAPGKKQGQGPTDRPGDEGRKSRGSRRRRRRPKPDGGDPQQAAPQRAPAGPAGEPGKGAPRKRGRRRRRPRDGAAEAPALERPPSEAEEPQDLTFPDEDDWDLDEPQAPPIRAREEVVSPVADGDDLVLDLDLDPDAPEPEGRLRNVVMVRFRDPASVQRFEAGEVHFGPGERVVAETDQGLAIGAVAGCSRREVIRGSLPRVLRRVDANDMRQEARNTVREREAFELCRERIQQRKLPMKLIRVEYLHGGNKAMFFFAAEHRVDFRELVKDLAQRLHTRIVMRQVGVRDEAKMTGGIGSCGMPLCCAGWLPKFDPVSIRMAKDQNLVLNPQKVSGQCGRLKCCLTYEQSVYQEARRRLPKLGKQVRTPQGQGKVIELDVLRGLVKVALGEGKVEIFQAEQVEAAAPPTKV